MPEAMARVTTRRQAMLRALRSAAKLGSTRRLGRSGFLRYADLMRSRNAARMMHPLQTGKKKKKKNPHTHRRTHNEMIVMSKGKKQEEVETD